MRLRLTIATVVAASLVLAGCSVFDTAAATVGGEKIDDDRFQRIVAFVLADPRFAEQPEQSQEEIDASREELTRQMLTFLIQGEIIRARAADADLTAPRDEVQELLDAQVEQLGGQEEFDALVASSDVSLADVRGLLEAQVLRNVVAEDVLDEELSDEDLRAVYDERAGEFTEVSVAHILVEDEAQAEDLAARATTENFPRLAERFSEDPGSAPEGGDLGTNPATDFVEAFGQATLEIPIGEIGGPVQSDFGFHVIWVKDREEQSFEDVREQLRGERAGEVFGEWMLARLREADVRVNPRYGIFDADTGQVVARTATTPLPGPQVTP